MILTISPAESLFDVTEDIAAVAAEDVVEAKGIWLVHDVTFCITGICIVGSREANLHSIHRNSSFGDLTVSKVFW